MRGTEMLQEIRKMRFEEVYFGWSESRLNQEEAARILGVCDRTFRRYIDRYEEAGISGLSDKRLTQASFHRAPVDEVDGRRGALREPAPGLECEAFLQLVSTGWRRAQLHMGEKHASVARFGFYIGQAGSTS